MKTLSPYPVLDNRPIDQWKVTELKEELRRRRLTIKGLKDDLVKRLAEALDDEHESVKESNDNNDFNAAPQSVVHDQEESDFADTPQPKVQSEDIGLLGNNTDVEEQTMVYQKTESMTTHGNYAENYENIITGKNEERVVSVTSVETSIVVNEALTEKENLPDEEVVCGAGLVKNEEPINHVTYVETSVIVNESMTPEVATDLKDSLKDVFGSVGDDSKSQFEGQESEPSQNAEVANPPHDDVKLDSSDPSNQVSEVNTVLGFQVKSDSISSDTLSINEKNELKDNIIDDNVKLELDVKPEVASSVISDGSEPHLMDVEELCDKKEPGDEGNGNSEKSMKNDSLDVGSSEKLNLDRSSGDDSMDDDTIENKPIDSKFNSEGVVNEGEKIEEPIMEETPVIMSEDVIAENNEVVDEIKKVAAAPIGKRKLNDQEVVVNNEISKRQRRWNTGTVKVPEPQNNTTASITPKDTLPSTALKRNFTRSDSTASEETPKERIVPPSPKSPTTSLKIDRFLRPFTLKAVQELLGKTGSVTSFWMDHIKTHCYVTYSSVEEAVETRNALYNLQWPPNGGRFLLAEFVDPQEVKTRADAPLPSPVTPVATMPTLPPTTGQPPRQQRQQGLPPPPPLPLPPPPPLSNPAQARERLPPPPPMEKTEMIDTPIVTLDDLFRKTKTTPRIYYLPLTDEQVAAKRRNMRQ